MKKAGWKKRIKSQCEKAGTYQEFFEDVIDTLAEIMRKRDDAQDEYERFGSHPVVSHTNKAGATNAVKNPLLVVINEQNAQRLAYWRDLGLTPKGYRALTGEAISKGEETNPLIDIIKSIGQS